MTSSPAGRIALGVLAALLLAAPAAQASHYPLEDAAFLTPEEVQALTGAGIGDTEALLAATGAKERGALATKSGLPERRLIELHELCDLLQIRGIGPKLAQLLRLTGVYDAAALGKETGAALAPRLKAANDVHKLSELLPEPAVLDGWIEQARSLPR